MNHSAVFCEIPQVSQLNKLTKKSLIPSHPPSSELLSAEDKGLGKGTSYRHAFTAGKN